MELVRDRARVRDAWTAFWQDPASGLGCIRGAPDITQALRSHWSSFANSLDASAHVLDLGCGAGAAAGAIVAARRDLQVTGIDFARVPAASDACIRLISDTAMEQLPFEEASFDAAVSQFGFEYSRTHKTAHQMARVLRPAGRFSFVVHHAESSVVAANRASLDAIRAIQEVDMREAFLAGNAFALGAKLNSLQRAHPGDTLVAELTRSLPARARQGGGKRRRVERGGGDPRAGARDPGSAGFLLRRARRTRRLARAFAPVLRCHVHVDPAQAEWHPDRLANRGNEEARKLRVTKVRRATELRVTQFPSELREPEPACAHFVQRGRGYLQPRRFS